MRGGKLTWRVSRRHREVTSPALAGFDFGDARSFYEDYLSRSSVGEPLVGEERQTLDKTGRGTLSLTLNRDDVTSPQDLMVTAEVEDETHR